MEEIKGVTLAAQEGKAPKIEIVREDTVIPSMVKLDEPFDAKFKITVYIEDFSGIVVAGFGIETRRKIIRLAEESVDLTGTNGNMTITWKLPAPSTKELLEWWLDAFNENYIPEETSTLRFYVVCGYKEGETYCATDYQSYDVLVEVPEIPWEKILMAGAVCVGVGAILYGVTR